jgi:leucyl/phenylalanyl-tRNA---protein transferase
MTPARTEPVLLRAELLWFPDPRDFPPDGLVAVGQTMSVQRLLLAYRSGLFPWTSAPVTWWCPDPRAILELDKLHVSRSLAKIIRQGRLQVTVDSSFQAVMEGCARTRPAETWITPDFIAAYTQLHLAGHAHSLECWLDGELVGGIYGVVIGGFFSAESMFHRVNDASKVALWHLVQRLRERGFALLDIQMLTPFTRQMGGTPIPRQAYLERLAQAIELPCRFVG